MLNGALIRSAREEHGISQAALAGRLGVVELTVWRWENKPTKSLDYLTVRGLVEALGLDEESLFVHDPNASGDADTAPLNHPAPTASSARESAAGAR